MLNYLDHTLTNREIAKEIRLFNLKDILLNRYNEIWSRFFDERRRLFLIQNRTTVILGILSSIGAAFIYVYIVLQASFTHITLGDLALYLQAVIQARRSLFILFIQVGQLYENALFLGSLFEFLNMSSGMVTKEGKEDEQNQLKLTAPSISKPLKQGIEFRNVSFKYPLTNRFVLRNMSFKILPGETVALVGENGAGKTTLVKLLTRLYDPYRRGDSIGRTFFKRI